MKRIPAFITLTIITLVAAVLLAITDSVTRGPISEAALTASDGARIAVLPAAESFALVENAEGVDSLYTANAGGQEIGKVATVTAQGFAGPVEVTVGVDASGAITGLSVGGSGFAETAGLGSKAQEPAFTDQFMGKAIPVTLGETVDAIAGATITSKAVVDGVNQAATAMGLSASPAAPAVGAPAECESAAPAVGNSNEVTVSVEGEAATETATSETHAESAADTHASATGAAAASSSEVAKQLPQVTGAIQAAGTASASALGFAGPVQVTVTVDATGAITALTIGGSRFAETDGLGSKVKDDAFTAQFLGLKAPFALSDIDAVSGATISSEAAVNAINAAYAVMCQ